jgi:hypothetical protein
MGSHMSSSSCSLRPGKSTRSIRGDLHLQGPLAATVLTVAKLSHTTVVPDVGLFMPFAGSSTSCLISIPLYLLS